MAAVSDRGGRVDDEVDGVHRVPTPDSTVCSLEDAIRARHVTDLRAAVLALE